MTSPLRSPARPLALVVACVAGLGGLPGVRSSGAASASEPAASLDAEILYSGRLTFDRDRTPVVGVGLMVGQPRVRLTATSGMRVELAGPARAQVQIPAGSTVVATVSQGTPGETRYRVVLGAFSVGDREGLRRAEETWRTREVQVETLELGTIFGLPDGVLDNRRTLLCERGTLPSPAAARQRARALSERYGLPGRGASVHAEPVRRGRGTIVLKDARTGHAISQRELIRVRAEDGGPILIGGAARGAQPPARRYRGTIVLAVDRGGALAVVNMLSVEALLRGVVPAEIYSSAPPAALDAQTIAARTTLLARIGDRHLADPFHICSAEHCQVYAGMDAERPETDAAIARTSGQVLFGEGDRLVDAVYSAACGGHTESNENVWGSGPHPALRGRPDAPADVPAPWPLGQAPTEDALRRFLADPAPRSYCATGGRAARLFRWQRELSDGELARSAGEHRGLGEIVGLDVTTRGVSGRAIELRLEGSEGEVLVHGELAIRRLLGGLPSALFVAERRPGGWHLLGGGHGHGVGLCQHGAIGMAEAGLDALTILGHYYAGAEVRRLY